VSLPANTARRCLAAPPRPHRRIEQLDLGSMPARIEGAKVPVRPVWPLGRIRKSESLGEAVEELRAKDGA
jgi:hypothetical protein